MLVIWSLLIIISISNGCTEQYLSDLTPTSEHVGWTDNVNTGVNIWFGNTMDMANGESYDRFLVIHPSADGQPQAYKTYALNGQYKVFSAVVGAARKSNGCENGANFGTFSIEIQVDGDIRYYRGSYGQFGYDEVIIDVDGANELTIRTDNGGDNYGCDHPAIAGPMLSCTDGIYIGCYVDTGNRALRYGPMQYGYTPDSCAATCSEYKYFSLQNGGWCACEDDFDHATKYGEGTGCPASRAGAGWRNDLFRNALYCGETYLTDLVPTNINQGWIDGANLHLGQNTWFGNTMEMGNGETYNQFLVIHPRQDSTEASRTYALNGEYKVFTATVGAARTSNGCENNENYGTFSIRITVDGDERYFRDGYGQTGYDEVVIDVRGANELVISTGNQGNWGCDHPAIAGPKLSCYQGEYVGCYVDTGNRAMRYGPMQYGYDPSLCSEACDDYKYFALQNNGWCSCENDLGHATKYGGPTSGCPINRMGGGWRNDIFENILYEEPEMCDVILLDKTGETITASQGNSVGTITIHDTMIIEMTVNIGQLDADSGYWESVFHIGNANGERWPGLWFHPNSNQNDATYGDGFHMSYGTTSNGNPWNVASNSGDAFTDGMTLKYKSVQTQTRLTITENDVEVYDQYYDPHPLATGVNVYVGDPWYPAADVTITDLVIKTQRPCDQTCLPMVTHVSAYLSGDPHFGTFNGVVHHFQGDIYVDGYQENGRPNNVQFYLMTSCDPDDKEDQPFAMIGSFAQYGNGPMTLVNYVVLVLYDDVNDETFYVFLAGGYANHASIPPLRYYVKESEGGNSHRRNNRNIPQTEIALDAVTSIGKFTLEISGHDTHYTNVKLTNTDDCELNFELRLEGNGGTYRWHFLRVQPPQCYFCSNCGLFGDFQTAFGEPSLLTCDGERYTYNPNRWIPSGPGFDRNGWTYRVNYHDEECRSDEETTEPPEFDECPAGSEEQIAAILACQQARDELASCCDRLRGGFCRGLQEACQDDACLEVLYIEGATLDGAVQSLFTDIVQAECDASNTFGPVPKLYYDFAGDLSESMTGDAKYDLQAVDVSYDRGYLSCDPFNADGSQKDSYAVSAENLDFEIGPHTLEVLISLDNLDARGGGAIAIDGNYDADYNNNDVYSHFKFDSIVYNEISGNRKWMLGSEFFRRTSTAGGTTVETVSGQYIHLVGAYDTDSNGYRLYRNGVEEQSYTINAYAPFTAAANSGVRMMFCQRHLGAGGSDFSGRIRYGAYYDKALDAGEVLQLYTDAMVRVGGALFENVGDELLPGSVLTEGQALVSLNGQYVAAMQEDGNFVVYNICNDPPTDIFATGTFGEGDLYFRLDGELAVAIAGATQYSNGESVGNPKFLIMQDDGNLVSYRINDNGDDRQLIAFWDSKGHTKWNDVYVPAKMGFLNNLMPSTISSSTTSTSTMSYMMYFIGVLLIANIICFMVYCYQKRDGRKVRYKIVDPESDVN